MTTSESDQLCPTLETAHVFDLPLHLSADYGQWILSQIRRRQGLHVITLNAEMSMQAKQDAALAAVIQKADLVVPDGAGVVLYFWVRGRSIRRSPGIELAEQVICACGSEPSIPIFFFGGKPGVAEAAAHQWQQQLPALAIAGIQHGYVTDDDESRLRQRLQVLQPGVVLVGLGVPRQEFWIAEHRYLCPHAVWIGVGGSFDIWAGTKDRAPQWFCDNNLEWMYRLYQEPWRWRRMMALPKFAWRALIER